ncbi:MAG: glycoside hydrolase family 3 protein [Cloacibacterium sp.]|nr:glycoside hydrolase family 3 protein [Cloacibacterium sp.]
MIFNKNIFFAFFSILSINIFGQYFPKNGDQKLYQKAEKYADSLYQQLSLDEKIGQLYIVALYNNRGEEEIQKIRNLVEKEKIGGLILMQDDAEKHINLLNEFQGKSRIKMMIGIDGEWGLFQRFSAAHKFPWAMTLGAIQDNSLIYEMTSKIAEDCKRMGIYWDFAPVVDVNTNPSNPIIGNRSFGSDINNVISKGLAYAQGLQDHGVLASMKHFPGHGDTNTDSHLDLPVVSHNLERLNSVELAPFKALLDKKIGGVMVAHLYVPTLEKKKGIPASVSYEIITNLLKNTYQYKGLIITDALNMNAIAKKFSPGEIDLRAFKAGNDIMLFSQDVPSGKALIKSAFEKGEISENRLAESVKKILKTKFLLGLQDLKPINPENINVDLNNTSHAEISEKLYANAITLLKDEKNLLPLSCSKTYYYLPLEEAPFQTFVENLNFGTTINLISKEEISQIPENSTVIVGFHKDNSTAYKPYKISQNGKNILTELSKKQNVILDVFGSPYALKDIDIASISTILVSYENNDLSMKASAKALLGKTKISGKLPVIVNENLKAGTGIEK